MKTAVQQLAIQLKKNHGIDLTLYDEFNEAKEMEKKHIKYAYLNGRYESYKVVMSDNFYAEQYYNETFKQEEQ